MTKKNQSPKTPKPPAPAPASRAAGIVLVLLALAGVGLSWELTRIYVKVRLDPSFETVCAINQKLNCMTAAESKYAAVLGVPTSIAGVGGYLAIIAAALIALLGKDQSRKAAAATAFGLTACSLVVGLYLFYVSEFVIKVLCPYCLATYAVNLCAFAAAGFLLKAQGGKQAVLDLVALLDTPGELVRALAPAAAAALVLAAAPVLAFKLTYGEVKAQVPKLGEFRVGTTDDGLPWIGAPEPVLTISVFTDYQCPHCKKTNAAVLTLLAKYQDRVRIVHRNLPLDEHCHPLVKHPFHPCACLYASYAVCAGEQGVENFWKVSEYLFATPENEECRAPLPIIVDNGLDAEAMQKCLASERPRRSVIKDIQDATKLGIMGTPTFVVDGNTIPGADLNQQTIEALLKVYPAKR